MSSNDEMIFCLKQDGDHIEFPTVIAIGCSVLQVKQHVIDIEISAFGEDDDVVAIDH